MRDLHISPEKNLNTLGNTKKSVPVISRITSHKAPRLQATRED